MIIILPSNEENANTLSPKPRKPSPGLLGLSLGAWVYIYTTPTPSLRLPNARRVPLEKVDDGKLIRLLIKRKRAVLVVAVVVCAGRVCVWGVWSLNMSH